ncbi:MAG TPA: aliphatic sulfonates ABC transporter substrate-binding protein [Deltaproteobacteria bacterium]|jgi:NitT/TauT family transport system substrate-binding protein|nr:aliphatic sulfonates ABC transporter substrate-binding protein [Deltaproteobacteria bacterium]
MSELRSLPHTALLLLAALAASTAFGAVKVGVSDWTGWVAWYVAQDQGYFRKYGADVKLVWFANYSDSIAALSTGQLDANSQTWSDTLGPLAKGLPLKVVLVNDNSAGNDALMVGPKIRGFADLRGHKVALEQYSISHFVLYTALTRNGLSAKDVQVINLSAGDAAAAFISGSVDAAVVWNPWISQIEKSGTGRPLFTSREMPGLIPDLLVAQTQAVQDHRKDFIAMIRAWFDTEAFIRTQPERAVAIMSKVVGLSPDQYRVFLPGTHFFDATANLEAFDPKSPRSLAQVAPTIGAFLLSNKLIEAVPDAARAVDGTLLQAAVAAPPSQATSPRRQ